MTEEEKDDCQICNGKNGGVKGNENIIDGIVMCDYCDAKREKEGMLEQEIVLRWKQNDRYFASPNITDEMREWALSHKKDMQEFGSTKWTPLRDLSLYFPFMTYRLRPDFELPKEPEFEYLEIKTSVEDVQTVDVAGWTIPASSAISHRRFVGYCVAKDDTMPFDGIFKPFHKYVKIRRIAE